MSSNTAPASNSTLRNATVEWFQHKPDYGFLIADSHDRELFVHHSDIVADDYRSLNEGQRVDLQRTKSAKRSTSLIRYGLFGSADTYALPVTLG